MDNVSDELYSSLPFLMTCLDLPNVVSKQSSFQMRNLSRAPCAFGNAFLLLALPICMFYQLLLCQQSQLLLGISSLCSVLQCSQICTICELCYCTSPAGSVKLYKMQPSHQTSKINGIFFMWTWNLYPNALKSRSRNSV